MQSYFELTDIDFTTIQHYLYLQSFRHNDIQDFLPGHLLEQCNISNEVSGHIIDEDVSDEKGRFNNFLAKDVEYCRIVLRSLLRTVGYVEICFCTSRRSVFFEIPWHLPEDRCLHPEL